MLINTRDGKSSRANAYDVKHDYANYCPSKWKTCGSRPFGDFSYIQDDSVFHHKS